MKNLDSRTIDDQPKEIKELKTKFEDTISDNVPNGLSPVRSIHHCID